MTKKEDELVKTTTRRDKAKIKTSNIRKSKF